MTEEEPEPRVDVSDRARRLRWQLGVAACIAAVAVFALVSNLRDRGDSTPTAGQPFSYGQSLDCKDGEATTSRDGVPAENGVETPELAVQELATASPLHFDASQWQNEGPADDADARDPEDPPAGSLVFVRRDGSKVTGQILVSPVGSGWAAGPVTLCR